MHIMQVKYVLFVIVWAVPSLLHMADSHEYCSSEGLKNGYAFCTPRHTSLTLEYVPRISHRITYIDLSGQPLKQLPRNAFRNVTIQNALTKIYISYCQIQHIDTDAFMNLIGLKSLYIHGNNISRFETGTFQHTKQLIHLVADYNKIEQLQTGLFDNLVHLKEVTFKNNTITYIGQETFRNTPSLFYIDVEYNELEYLSPLFTDNFVNITRLLLQGNPWNCDCNLKRFYEKNRVRKPKYSEPIPICQNPPALRGIKWTDLTSDAFKCDAGMILPKNDTRMVTVDSNVTLPYAVHTDHGNGSNTDEDNA